jgi:hypothetical protein
MAKQILSSPTNNINNINQNNNQNNIQNNINHNSSINLNDQSRSVQMSSDMMQNISVSIKPLQSEENVEDENPSQKQYRQIN